MKKIFVVTILGLFLTISCESKKEEAAIHQTEKIADEHNAKNSLDYLGIYKGILPCADCEGIETEIILSKDETYIKKTKYLGKDEKVFEELGDFTWQEDGNTMSLEGIDTEPTLYFVSENKLIQLDQEGNKIEGNLAKNYELLKQ